MVRHRTMLIKSTNRPIESRIMIYLTAPFSITLNDLYPRFQGHAIFNAEYLRKGTIYRQIFNGILIGTYALQCRFE